MNLNLFDEVYSKLNPDQKKAVDTIDGSVLVIAGPGTGKTQVLSLRIANILKQADVSPNSILCLTFQEASVVAMKNRLQKFIGKDAFKVQIHTFHSFCSEIIRTFPHEFYFEGNVEPIKEIEKLEIFEQILKENQLLNLQQKNDALGFFKAINSAISQLKKDYITPEKFEKLISDYENSLEEKELKREARRIERLKELNVFYKEYLHVMRDSNRIDFDDMIYYVTDAFARNEDLVKYFQEQYLYTLVDEFQDTNNAQLQVIKAVAQFENLTANVFAVGDDDQTIFRFQGASSNNFEKYLHIFPETEIIVLHTNYRSNQDIINTSSSVIENNPARVSQSEVFTSLGLNKDFKAFKTHQSDENVQVHEFVNSLHEDYWIGKKVLELKNKGVKLNEIALIARNNKQITSITKFLDKFEIGYTIKRSDSILKNRHIQNLASLLEIIENPLILKNDRILWQILSQGYSGLDSFDIFTVFNEAKKQKQGIYDFILATNLPRYDKIKSFLHQVIAMNHYALNNTVLNTFSKCLQAFNYIAYLESLDDYVVNLNKVSSFYQFISTRSRRVEGYSLEQLIREIKLMNDKNIVIEADPIEFDAESKINILTAHSSKGLEFDHVFIYQAIENFWEGSRGAVNFLSLPPEDNGLKEANKILEKEEAEIDERRLFYVAMTRAKEQLYITYSTHYLDSDSGELDTKEKIRSRFVNEAGITNQQNHKELAEQHAEIAGILLEEPKKIEITERNRTYLINLVQQSLALSPSKLNVYEKCHYKFLLEHVYKLPQESNASLAIGNAIHKGIEILHRSYSKNPTKLVTYEWLLQEVTNYFNENLPAEEVDMENINREVAYKEMENGLRAYYSHFVTKPVKAISNEFTSYGVWEGIKIVGRIDRISEEGSYEFVITDFKTSSNPPTITHFLGLTKDNDTNHLHQLLFYKLLLGNANDLKSRDYSAKVTNLRIEYINTKEGQVTEITIPTQGLLEYKERSNSKTTKEFDLDAQMELLKTRLSETFNSIKNLEFERTTNLKECERCPFRRHCGR